MKRKILLLIFAFLIAWSYAYAQNDIVIESTGTLITGVSNPDGKLEVIGASGQDGIVGSADGTGAAGIYGEHATSGNKGMLGTDSNGVYGTSTTGNAGFFQGNARVTGNLTVDGTISGTINGTGLNADMLDGKHYSDISTEISSEASARSAADSTLQTNINNEASSRQSAGNTLTNNLNSEISRAQAAEAALQANINSETSARISANTSIADTLNTESTARQSADTTMQATIAAAGTRIESLEESISSVWQTAKLIEIDNTGAAIKPQIAVDADGNAIAVWSHASGTLTNIWANRYVAETGWGTPALIETEDLGQAFQPQIAMDSNGNAIAVWYQADASSSNIWANRYVPGTGWGTAQKIETDSGNAIYPQITMDAAGNALVVWTQHDGTRYNIKAGRYIAGSGWILPELIESDNASNAWNPQIAMNAAGDAVAVWYQSDGMRNNIWANRYTAGTSWGTAQLIETDNAADALEPQAVVDTDGNAIVVWKQSDGMRSNIWTNRYTTGTGWGTAQLLETDDTVSAGSPQVSVDSNGNAIAVWTLNGGVYARRYVPGTGWDTAQVVNSTDVAVDPQIEMDQNGNAIVVFEQFINPRYSIWANRYVAGKGWGTHYLLETDDTGNASDPQIAVSAGGSTAAAVWYQSDGARNNIWSNAYVTVSKGLAEHLADTAVHHTRYTDAEAVAAIKAADGSGSGLDADTLDGQDASAFSVLSHTHTETDPTVNALGKAALSCSANQIPKYVGSAWTCSTDADTNTTYTAGSGLDLTGTTFSVEFPLVLSGGAGAYLGNIQGTSISNYGIGVTGEATATGNQTNYGGKFTAAGNTGSGAYGVASGTTGKGIEGIASTTGAYTNYGGYFKSAGNTGRAVYGEATAVGAVTNYGGYFTAAGDSGRGVFAVVAGNGAYAIEAETNGGSSSVAVRGRAQGNVVGTSYGGMFSSGSQSGRGVYAYADLSGLNTNYGGYFTAAGDSGRGVYGSASGPSGIGVRANGGQYDFYAAGTGTNYGPFTGGHEVKLSEELPAVIRQGMILSSTGKAVERKTESGKTSLSSTLATVKLSDKANDKAVFGVFVSEAALPEDHWYTASEGERFGTVNALGEGRVLVISINGNVEAGDYITTSNVPGYGQRQNDDLLHSYTVGKAIETVNWDKVTETTAVNGVTYKVYLMAVVYTSG